MADENTAPDPSEFVEINLSPAPEGEPAGDVPAIPAEGEAAAEGEPAKEPVDGEELAEQGEKDGDAKPPLPDEATKPKKGAEARIGELTRARREAERTAEYWKGIATRNGAPTGDDAAPASKPTPDDFEDYGEYVEALTDWKVADRERKSADANAKTAETSVETHRAAEWGAKIGEAKAIHADFDAVMDKADTPTLPHVAQAIMDADRGPELLYHLANNPEIVDRLNEMSPYRAAMELGRIEDKLPSAAKAPPTPPRETTQSKAPAPITPVAPGSTTTKDPTKMDMEEYKAFRAKQGIR